MIALVGDIGGTNTTLAVIDTKKMDILHIDRRATKEISHFEKLINEFLDLAADAGYRPKQACFGVAGPIKQVKNRLVVHMTNSKLVISESALEKKTPLHHIRIINDFTALGLATNVLGNSTKKIHEEKKSNETCVIIGAGTGLGKALLVYDDVKKLYVPLPSEFGHTDLPMQEDERDLAKFLRRSLHTNTIEYEHVLSGDGIERIYRYLSKKNKSASQIALAQDMHAKKTMQIFTKFYARACRNAIIDGFALGGIFIAGGIAAKNPHLFNKEFLKELHNHHRKEYAQLLKKVPVILITDYDAGLKGATIVLEAGL